MVKIILFDVDGVLISQDERFSAKFSREFNIPLEKLNKFFTDDFPAAALGKADLIKIVKNHLADWGWDKSAEELLYYWVSSENYLDIDMIRSVVELKARGVKCGVVSNQEKYRAAYLSEEMGLGELMDFQFYSCDLGSFKSSREFWNLVYRELAPFAKSEILIWDDKNSAVASAREFGFKAELYTDFRNYQKILPRFL
jgi:FMN phosphatase YigB (HAD superfamily)